MGNIVFNSLPVDAPLRITSPFGKRSTGIVNASTFHKGVDLGRDWNKAETPILSVCKGKVINNFWNKYKGWVIIIQHEGFQTLYQHLATKSSLTVGTLVKAGQRIGTMGNSSDTNVLKVSIHLHFELIVNGVQIDSEPYLKHIVKETVIKEDDEVVEKIKIEINGVIKEVDAINKDGNNFVKLRDLTDAIFVDYDATRKLPIIKQK